MYFSSFNVHLYIINDISVIINDISVDIRQLRPTARDVCGGLYSQECGWAGSGPLRTSPVTATKVSAGNICI